MVITKPIIVAELSINHLGMVKIAQKMIDSAINSGADLVKFKYKNVNKYYKSDNKHWRNFNFKNYRKSLELSKEDFTTIATYCKKRQIKWFCTVHDLEGMEFIKSFNPPYYKIASMDTIRKDFLESVMQKCKQEEKPLIVSLGGKDDAFTDNLVKQINDLKIKAYLLHTVSIYPTPLGQSNVQYISKLKNKYENENIQIGYSGHETGYAPSLLAALQGAKMIERHFSLTRGFDIHHIEASITPKEFRDMVSLIETLGTESNTLGNSFNEEELKFLINKEYE